MYSTRPSPKRGHGARDINPHWTAASDGRGDEDDYVSTRGYSVCSISDDADCKDLQRMLCAKPAQRITVKHPEGNDLIRALRQSHRDEGQAAPQRAQDQGPAGEHDAQPVAVVDRGRALLPGACTLGDQQQHIRAGQERRLGLLHGLVAERYSGGISYDPTAKPLRRSAIYKLADEDQGTPEQVNVDDLAPAADDAAHTQGRAQRKCVYG